jgi:hypothetical protein
MVMQEKRNHWEEMVRNGAKAKKIGEPREKESDTRRKPREENDGQGNKEEKMGASDQDISIDELSRRRRLQPFDITNERFLS